MRINFVPTIGGNTYYLGDADDEEAPLVELKFISEFARIPRDIKKKVAEKVLSIAVHEIIEAMTRKDEKHNFLEEGF